MITRKVLADVLTVYEQAAMVSESHRWENPTSMQRVSALNIAVGAALEVEDFGNKTGDDHDGYGYRGLSVIKRAFLAEAERLWTERNGVLRLVDPTHPYVQMLDVAASLGWPNAYKRDLYVHDFNSLLDMETSFYWAIYPDGTHLNQNTMEHVLRVYGYQCQYFIYNRTENKLKPCDITERRYVNPYPKDDMIVCDLVVRR